MQPATNCSMALLTPLNKYIFSESILRNYILAMFNFYKYNTLA